MVDLSGLKIGKLTVLSPNTRRDNSRCVMWDCLCECGTVTTIRSVSLNTGRTRSCGCIAGGTTRHGHCTNGFQTPTYRTWRDMFTRCYNPKASYFGNYGGRGIGVCVRWFEFDNFLVDMGDRPKDKHCIDRKNPDWSYMPSNCRWATWQEAAKNQRHGNQHLAARSILSLSKETVRNLQG